jgi:hypothetical protein
MFVSQACFDLWAVKSFTSRELNFEEPSRLSTRHFKAMFLYTSREVAALWATLDKRHDFPLKRPDQLLWGLYYLKVYPTWDQMAVTTGISEKTLRKWVGIAVDYLAGIDQWVSGCGTVQFLAFVPLLQRLTKCYFFLLVITD